MASSCTRVWITHEFMAPIRLSRSIPCFVRRVVQVGPVGHEDAGDRPAHQRAFRVQVGPVAFELKLVAFVPANAPRLFGGHVLHAPQDVVGDARPTIVEAVADPERSELDDVIAIVEFH